MLCSRKPEHPSSIYENDHVLLENEIQFIFHFHEFFFQMRAHWMKSQKESMRLEEAGLGGDVLDSALAAFILEVSNNWQLLVLHT